MTRHDDYDDLYDAIRGRDPQDAMAAPGGILDTQIFDLSGGAASSKEPGA